ncbi:MAG: nuclear transport factor 2 family protein [Bacteroidetes bacterium]|jgi:ketosteroid isomerase-like protein|nr:nuclear transport factor 2 family protein [Bacteroidota bacterium]
MKKKLLMLFLSILVTQISFAQSNDEKIIRDAMNAQVTSWNNGNLDEFMQTYWQNDSMMFVGKKGVTYGWQNTLNNYKKAYPDTASMGKLNFSLIEVKRLSVLYYHVTGKWQLTRTGGNLEGYFTLLFKKIKGKWLIVSDHSS